ncbi:MAG: hypothetical protein EBQ92_11860 [Proteobacteria bacterium]|nr:hypothetical protein [Pseudomonadota bacterium]
MRFILGGLLCFLLLAPNATAETLGGGKGGPFIQYNNASLANFDKSIAGNPLIIGGIGFGWASKTFRVGGGGGGGFLWSGSESAQFGIGYGGMVGEYIISEWLMARLMIGGGGFSVSKIISETDSTLQVQRISSGGFLLFHPQVVADIKIGQWASLGFSIGYFLPNVGRLQSPSFSIQLMFGRI